MVHYEKLSKPCWPGINMGPPVWMCGEESKAHPAPEQTTSFGSPPAASSSSFILNSVLFQPSCKHLDGVIRSMSSWRGADEIGDPKFIALFDYGGRVALANSLAPNLPETFHQEFIFHVLSLAQTIFSHFFSPSCFLWLVFLCLLGGGVLLSPRQLLHLQGEAWHRSDEDFLLLFID